MKLTSNEVTKAVQAYARKNGYSVSTVRTSTHLRQTACQIHKDKAGK